MIGVYMILQKTNWKIYSGTHIPVIDYKHLKNQTINMFSYLLGIHR